MIQDQADVVIVRGGIIGAAAAYERFRAGLGVVRAERGDLTPNGLPVLGRAPGAEGVAVAADFSRHGFGIAPATATILRDLVLDEPPASDLDPFRFERFAGVLADAALTLHG